MREYGFVLFVAFPIDGFMVLIVSLFDGYCSSLGHYNIKSGRIVFKDDFLGGFFFCLPGRVRAMIELDDGAVPTLLGVMN